MSTNEIEKKHSQIKCWSNDIAELARNILTLCDDNSFLEKLQNNNAQLTKTVKDFKRKLAEEKKKYFSLENTNKYLEARANDLSDDHDKLSKENDELNEKLNELMDTNKLLTLKNQQYENKIRVQASRIEDQVKIINSQDEVIHDIQNTIDLWENSSREQVESIRRITRNYSIKSE
ncbi:hypothetical protein H8356DRAFT_999233 [Neocallimastix lanati (nom. inval.)]|uniref:Uncharacterized protein n=1 Tax=Neocallimastix californiae TaxID=1754190 RepID=A0A1Y2EJ51_9FUNG|nr:hypothetical protein H8356DRAFT_999233 [Neocallimastix sp. JGI-2020a]ORY70835.1 hypothetical protein LY90DRAFT_667272 [Neocallimastix californiae]|eukprot:ORY70835.1 hypothetical protein LY90DRAFT_667272 [Neocallimastix californiae]